ncbi:c-type cytochrome [Conexibacter sp. CPCC 206217]|uniref:c-type cytochrome n=1 Tax=Conexibacter sp. CPCC 206217 TaxID=3064574 RepID=UPI002718CE88|nr:c-type cytochrome [Conexibacter sp. CPCC 206217]MDO8213215.1 c-type cytochrome [Conexibacter sp. CPCC 206217]
MEVEKQRSGGAPGSRSSRGGGSTVVILAVALLTIVAALGIGFVIAGNADENDQTVTTPAGTSVTLTAAEAKGRAQFGETCANCHTLAAADAVGKVGPDLDIVRPDRALVLTMIRAGSGQMPPGLLSGTQAQDVAAFVAAATGAK